MPACLLAVMAAPLPDPHSAGYGVDVIGVIHRVSGEWSEIEGFDALAAQVFCDGFFVVHASVVASQGYFHGSYVLLSYLMYKGRAIFRDKGQWRDEITVK